MNTPTQTAIAVDLHQINSLLQPLTARERIAWASAHFGPGVYALTSAGVDSALLLDHLAQLKLSVPVIHINTGFLPKETLAFRDKLKKRYGFKLYEFGPTTQQIQAITDEQLWEVDLERYSQITKLAPLHQAITKLGVRVLLTGIRGDQTANRARLGFIGSGNDGELRINPFIDWSKREVNDYLSRYNLPRHPLYTQGFESVGDWHTTKPGTGRSGRTVIECGLHMVNGRLVRQKTA